MTQHGKLVYSPEDEEGKVLLDCQFFNLHKTLQVDILVDWINYIQGTLDSLIKEHKDGEYV